MQLTLVKIAEIKIKLLMETKCMQIIKDNTVYTVDLQCYIFIKGFN